MWAAVEAGQLLAAAHTGDGSEEGSGDVVHVQVAVLAGAVGRVEQCAEGELVYAAGVQRSGQRLSGCGVVRAVEQYVLYRLVLSGGRACRVRAERARLCRRCVRREAAADGGCVGAAV